MIAIIGGGISGLTVGNNLNKPFKIFEQNSQIGGICNQYYSGGFYYDYGGHYFHFQNKKRVKEFLSQFSKFLRYERNSQIHLFNKYIPFPVQYHLSYFPSPHRERIYNDLIQTPEINSENLKEALITTFGKNLFNLFFSPFLQKYYQTDLISLAAGHDKGSIPVPDRNLIESGLKGNTIRESGYNTSFYYPRGEMRTFFKTYSQNIYSNLHLKEKVCSIDLEKKQIITNHSCYSYSKLVNTMPLSLFLDSLIQKNLFTTTNKLRSTATQIVNLVLKIKRKKFHWIYLPSKNEIFYRAGYYTCPDITKCYLERTIQPHENFSRQDVFAFAKKTLKKLGMIKHSEEIIEINQKTIPISYILIDNNWNTLVPGIIKTLQNYGVESIGRYGGWKYSSMGEDVETGLKIAKRLNNEPD